MLHGTGKYMYELANWHAQYPEGWSPIEVNALAVDAQDNLYAFNTGEIPVTVFDRKGKLLNTWPKESFEHNHGATIDPDGSVYCADDGNHTVTKFTPDGKELLRLGKKDQPSDTGYTLISETGKPLNIMEAIRTTKRGGPPFNSPTDIALTISGEMYISDGYGNARVHKFTSDGILLFSWGEPGKGHGQFVVPHAIAIDKQGRVLVADRHNNRIQIFDAQGKYLTEWGDLDLPTDIFIDKDGTVYISELHPRVSIYNLEGKLLTRWGNEERDKDDPLFVALHSVVVDSRGDLYTAEVMGIHKGTPFLATRTTRMIQKFVKKS
jgi:DNA-binding beta-propeller fold protein YncE